MSKPIDQEREAYALIPVERSYNMRTAAIMHFNTARQEGKDLDDALDAAWRATLSKAHSPDDGRSAVQTAGVAVPDGYVLVPSVADLTMKNAGWQEADRQGVDPESIEMQTIWHAMLAAAPHPVSGEQKPVGEIVIFGSDLKEVSWSRGKMPEPGTKLYAAPPAAQDVSGLEEIIDLAEPLIDLLYSEKRIRGDGNPPGATIAKCEALLDLINAHRAQAQDIRSGYTCVYCGSDTGTPKPLSMMVYCGTCGKSCAASAAQAAAQAQGGDV